MQYLPIAARDSNINPLFVVAFTYFYFRRPADVKFFCDIIYAPENDRSFSLGSILRAIGSTSLKSKSIKTHLSKQSPFGFAR